jgi:hypothetical protein
MDLKDFSLEQSIFQLRYSPSFLLWDNAGSLWHDAQQKWPKLKMKRGEPNVTSFTLENKHEIAITTESASVVGHFPDSGLADFTEKVSYFVVETAKHLEIAEYTRIGLRLLFRKTYSSTETASMALYDSKLLNLPEGPHFGVKGAFRMPELTIRWESESLGVTVRLRAEGRKLDFDPPMDAPELKPVHEEKFGVVYDVDYYSKGSLLIGQFRADDWIKNVLHLIRRDSRSFLGV